VEGKFRTIVLDPPYSYRQSLAGRARPDYAVMSQKQLLALPVADWAERAAHIYVWTPNNCLPESARTHESIFVSVKTNGTGSIRQFAQKATRLKLPSGLLALGTVKERWNLTCSSTFSVIELKEDAQ
jgi:N6-adenosine-specific RNA methylase IME4